MFFWLLLQKWGTSCYSLFLGSAYLQESMATAAQSHNTSMCTPCSSYTHSVRSRHSWKCKKWKDQNLFFRLEASMCWLCQTAWSTLILLPHRDYSSLSRQAVEHFNLPPPWYSRVTLDAAVVGQTIHSTAATLWCDSAAECMKECDGRMYPLCLRQRGLGLYCLYCQVVGGHTQLQPSQVVIATHTRAHTLTHTKRCTSTFSEDLETKIKLEIIKVGLKKNQDSTGEWKPLW